MIIINKLIFIYNTLYITLILLTTITKQNIIQIYLTLYLQNV